MPTTLNVTETLTTILVDASGGFGGVSLPAYPSTAGAYTLIVTVTAGVGVLSWAAGGVSPPPPPPPVGSPSLDFSLAANSQYAVAPSPMRI